jgi:hypothetical protein
VPVSIFSAKDFNSLPGAKVISVDPTEAPLKAALQILAA